MVRYTIPISQDQEGNQVFLAYVAEIIRGIYKTCQISLIIEEDVMGIDIGSDFQLNFSLTDIWGYRLVSWDPLMRYVVEKYKEPNMPHDLFCEFMGTVLVKCTEPDHYENLRELLRRCYIFNLMAVPEEITSALGVPVISEQYGIIGTAGELSKAEIINYYLQQQDIKTTIP